LVEADKTKKGNLFAFDRHGTSDDFHSFHNLRRLLTAHPMANNRNRVTESGHIAGHLPGVNRTPMAGGHFFPGDIKNSEFPCLALVASGRV
jgi:hypothetical protein